MVGWGWMVFSRYVPLPISNLVSFGRWCHVKGRGYCRGEPGSVLSGVYAPDWRGWRETRSSTSQRNAEPLCVRIKSANWEVSKGKTDL